MLAIRRLVDRQVSPKRQDVGGHDPRELQRLAHCYLQVVSVSITDFDDTTRPKARPMMSRVARWISGHSVDTASSTTVIRYSRLNAPTTVARTQMSVIVPVTTSEVTPRARSTPSRSLPAKASYQRFWMTASPSRGASAAMTSALGSP